MTAGYIENNFPNIIGFENIIENRITAGGVNKSELIADNALNLKLCKKYNLPYILIDKTYNADVEL